MKNILLTIEYDGTQFSGWQRQPEKRTAQGEIERVLSKLCCADIQINGTSRTDAGVHAIAQRASFQGDFSIPVSNIPRAANNLLAGGMNQYKIGDIRITEAIEVDLDFHARFDCKGKTYVYKISAGNNLSVFERNYKYQIKEIPNIEAMKKAGKYIVGTHDFKCFEASGGNPRESTVRTIYDLNILEAEGEIEISVTGDGFLYNMVRIIVGTLIDVGYGKISPTDIPEIINSCDRQRAGHTAPPQGLYLKEIYFNEINIDKQVINM